MTVVVCHRTSDVDELHPGSWLVEPWGLQIARGPGASGWQVAMHGLADERLRQWMTEHLPQRFFDRYGDARAALRDALAASPPPSDWQLRLPTLIPCGDGRYRTAEGDLLVRRAPGGWRLQRGQLELGTDPAVPAWAAAARSLYEARMLVRYVRESDSPVRLLVA